MKKRTNLKTRAGWKLPAMIAHRPIRLRRGQAQAEYLLLVGLTLFVMMMAVNGVHSVNQDNLASFDDGTSQASDITVDTSGVNVPTTNVITIPGLKDALYVYEDRLFRWVADKKPREQLWGF